MTNKHNKQKQNQTVSNFKSKCDEHNNPQS